MSFLDWHFQAPTWTVSTWAGHPTADDHVGLMSPYEARIRTGNLGSEWTVYSERQREPDEDGTIHPRDVIGIGPARTAEQARTICEEVVAAHVYFTRQLRVREAAR